MAVDLSANRDLALSPNTYAYMQNEGKGGTISVHRGPCLINQTGQDKPIRFEFSDKKFRTCELSQSVQQFPRAAEGDYIILENPLVGDELKFPGKSEEQFNQELQPGRRIVIPGPWSNALWPGQIATVVEGHRLRSNQYLVVTIYNSSEASKNWEKTVVTEQTDQTDETIKTVRTVSKGLPRPESFAVGTRIVIRGSDVSFYIPCTGVEVSKDSDGNYVREAVTLEQMEYCCLVDESGKKEYPHGPKVVFPTPTQVFETDKKKRRKFKPLELNTINGVHCKVTADFKGPDYENDISKERDYKEGTELFITGKTTAIFYPREELAIIEYGQGNKKHFSTAIPKGEGRYVINRNTGEIKMIRGPEMYLADPRFEIPVRRPLDLTDVARWYPGNQEALQYNESLAQTMAVSASGRSGVVSEGDYRKQVMRTAKRGGFESQAAMYLSASDGIGASDEYSPEDLGEAGDLSENITRGTQYTQPRTLTLNTKYDGVPKIEVWPGYAVLVVGAEGSRRVVQGPEVILLEYDEKLGHTEVSTGKPKTTDRLHDITYLCIQNNQISDIIDFESSDDIGGTIQIKLRVNFEAENDDDRLKWFNTDNYVKFLCDHVRSILKGMSKKHTIAEIKAQHIDLVRDAILGKKPDQSVGQSTKRPGLVFESNGMRVVEVEVLGLKLKDQTISTMLEQAQQKVVKTNIEIQSAQKELEATRAREQIAREMAEEQHLTQKARLDLQKALLNDQLTLALSQVEAELKKLEASEQNQIKEQEIKAIEHNANLDREKKTSDQRFSFQQREQELAVVKLSKETESAVARFEAAKDGLYEVLTMLHRDDLAVKLAEGCTIERWLSGDDANSAIGNLLSMVPTLKGFFDKADTLEMPKNRLAKRATEKTS